MDNANIPKTGTSGSILMAALLLALAAAVAVFTAAPAQAAVVRCGQVLVTDTVLDNNLNNCPADGLIIGRSGITVNLNGHTVDGVGLGVGLRNNGFDDVRLTNSSTTPASVQEFDYGVQLNAGTLRNFVEKLTIQKNELAGVQLNNADSNTVRNNTVQNQSKDGISLMAGSALNVVSNNTVANNQGDGINLVGATAGNRLQSNRVSDSSDIGVNLEAGSNSNTLLTNTINDSGDAAVSVTNSNGNRLERNTTGTTGVIGDAGVALSLASSNVLVSNTVRNSSDAAISLQDSDGNTLRSNDVRFNPTGISLDKSDRNRLESNNASNSTSEGIELQESLDNDLVLNTASSNNAEGIVVKGVTSVALGNLLNRNTTSSNEADGILVSGSGHTIRSNTARNNEGWGIYAAPGNANGGGNRASGNAEPAQCFGVRCTP